MTKLKTIKVQGKSYVTVNDRLKHFRENHAGFCLETEVLEVTGDTALMRAVIRNDKGVLVATGVAREVRTDANSFVNKTSYVENCETSAWGRALANFGIGIDETVASADEVVNAINAPQRNNTVTTKVETLAKEVVEKSKPSMQTAIETIAKCETHKALNMVFAQVMKYEWTLDAQQELKEEKDAAYDRIEILLT